MPKSTIYPKPSRNAVIRLGLLIAAAVAALVVAAVAAVLPIWAYHRPGYAAEAYVEIFDGPDLPFQRQRPRDESAFQRRLREHQLMARSQLILETALARSEVASLEIVKAQKDRVKWLMESLKVDFPEFDNVMRLRIYGPHEALSEECVLLNAVVDAYVNRVVMESRLQRARERETLNTALTELRKELAAKELEFSELPTSANAALPPTPQRVALRLEIETLERVALDLAERSLRLRLLLETEARVSRSGESSDFGAPLRIIQPASPAE